MRKRLLQFLMLIAAFISYYGVYAQSPTMPTLSTDTETHWYYIQFSKGEGVVQDMGADAEIKVQQSTPARDAQLWKVTQNGENYIIQSKLGNKLNHTAGDDLYKTNGTESVEFKIIASTNSSYTDSWMLEEVTTEDNKYFVQWGGSGVGRSIGAWNNAADPNGALKFIAADDMFPPSAVPMLEDTWYYIKAGKAKVVLQSMGDEAEVTTQLPKQGDNDSSQVWMATESGGNYILENKLGKKLYFDAGVLKAGSTGTPLVFEASSEEGWVLKDPADNKYLKIGDEQGYVKKFAKADAVTGCGLTFIEESTLTSFPSSSVPVDQWCYIQMLNGNIVLQNMGEGQNILTKHSKKEEDAQLWKLVLQDDGNYILENKAGQKLNYANNRFVAGADGAKFTINLSTALHHEYDWLIERVGGTFLHQTEEDVADKELDENADQEAEGSIVRFVTPQNMLYLPQMTTDGDTTWYYVSMKTGGVLEDKGNNENMQVGRKLADKAEQFWFIQSVGNGKYTMGNKVGRKLNFDTSDDVKRFQASEESGIEFRFVESTTSPKGWLIHREGSEDGYLNQFNGAGIGKELAEYYNQGDMNSVIEFELASEALTPPASDTWFFVQMSDGGNVLQDMGDGENILTKTAVENEDTQLWKLVGDNESGYALLNKSGNKLYFTANRFKAGSSDTIDFTFYLVESKNDMYKGDWLIQPKGLSGQLNQNQGSGVNKELIIYNNLADKNSALKFVDPADMQYPPQQNTLESGNYYVKIGDKYLTCSENSSTTLDIVDKVGNDASEDDKKEQVWRITKGDDGYTFYNLKYTTRVLNYKLELEAGSYDTSYVFNIYFLKDTGKYAIRNTTDSVPYWKYDGSAIKLETSEDNAFIFEFETYTASTTGINDIDIDGNIKLVVDDNVVGVESDIQVQKLTLFAINGVKIKATYDNYISKGDVRAGIYILVVELSNGKTVTEKLVID